MAKDIRVLIVEDDPYARDLMSLLLTRDWRTRVVGEATGEAGVNRFFSEAMQSADIVILDTEIPGESELPFRLAAITQKAPHPPKILYTANQTRQAILHELLHSNGWGYVLKAEILYALGAAVTAINAGYHVITPGVLRTAGRYAFPEGTLILDGRQLTEKFSHREKELIRLGIIFNLAIRDIADELVLGTGWVSEIVSMIYKKLGVREILTGEVPLELYFTDEAVLEHCREIIQRATSGKSNGLPRKAPWMSTLAFHLLTVPKREEL